MSSRTPRDTSSLRPLNEASTVLLSLNAHSKERKGNDTDDSIPTEALTRVLEEEVVAQKAWDEAKATHGVSHPITIEAGLTLLENLILQYKLQPMEVIISEIEPHCYELSQQFSSSSSSSSSSALSTPLSTTGKESTCHFRCLQLKAFMYYKQFKYTSALHYFLLFIQSIGPSPIILENTGHTYNALCEYDKALYCFYTALCLRKIEYILGQRDISCIFQHPPSTLLSTDATHQVQREIRSSDDKVSSPQSPETPQLSTQTPDVDVASTHSPLTDLLAKLPPEQADLVSKYTVYDHQTSRVYIYVPDYSLVLKPQPDAVKPSSTDSPTPKDSSKEKATSEDGPVESSSVISSSASPSSLLSPSPYIFDIKLVDNTIYDTLFQSLIKIPQLSLLLGGILLGISSSLQYKLQYIPSLYALQQALKIYKLYYNNNNNYSIIAKTLLSMANIYSALGKMMLAQRTASEAVRIFKITCGQSPLTANALLSYSTILSSLIINNNKSSNTPTNTTITATTTPQNTPLSQAEKYTHLVTAIKLLDDALNMYIKFDILDIPSIITVLRSILDLKPQLLGKGYPTLHDEPLNLITAFSPYIKPLEECIEQVYMQGLADTDNAALLFKVAGEFLLLGADIKQGYGLIECARLYFTTINDIDCTTLIKSCDQLLDMAKTMAQERQIKL